MTLNEKLAKWAGFYNITPQMLIKDSYKELMARCWHYPNGQHCYHLPDFITSLDACFRWLVPKFKYCCITKPEHKSFNNMWLAEVRWGDETWQAKGHGEDKHPAKALCLAIEKLIE